MQFLIDLWLPIVLSGVVVFILSALAWMVMPHHKGDVHGFPDEQGMVASVRAASLHPGQYMYPYCETGEEMKSEEFKKKAQEGPYFTLTMWKGQPNMSKNMAATLLFMIGVSIVVAYLTFEARTPGAGFMSVLQIAGATAFLGYAAGGIPNAIWFGRPIRGVITDTFDALIYAIVTGVIFALMWPDVAAATNVPAVPGG